MTIVITDRGNTWSSTRGMWFHGHKGDEFDVVAVYGATEPVYEVSVAELAANGEVDFTEAFVPAAFAQVVQAPSGILQTSYA